MRRRADYIGSIKRDGRTILLEGAAVDDVTSHPGFSGPVGVIASLYGGAIDNSAITYEEDGHTHDATWLALRTAEDLAQRHAVHSHWAEGSFGLMGRTPDYVAAILTTFTARGDVIDRGGRRFSDNATAFHARARDNHWFVSYAVTLTDRRRAGHPGLSH